MIKLINQWREARIQSKIKELECLIEQREAALEIKNYVEKSGGLYFSLWSDIIQDRTTIIRAK
jgi:hypothetical protein